MFFEKVRGEDMTRPIRINNVMVETCHSVENTFLIYYEGVFIASISKRQLNWCDRNALRAEEILEIVDVVTDLLLIEKINEK